MNDPFIDFYNQKHLTQISQRGYYTEKINFVLSNLSRISKGKKINIIDVACNDGYLSKLYLKYGEVTGVDLNKQSAVACRKLGIKCLNMDVMEVPVAYHGKFDVVIASDIIEHVFNTDQFLQKLKSFLVQGGWLILTTANVASLGRRLMLLLGQNPFLEYSLLLPYPEFNVGHIRYYTSSNFVDQLKLLGFKNVSIEADKINLTSKIAIPYPIAKHFPSLGRNLLVTCQK